MLKNKFAKIALVLMCLITVVMPYTTTVLAATFELTKESTKADLQVLIMHEGGECRGDLSDDQKILYDKNPYGYFVGDKRVFKIIVKGDTDYTNMFYCLNGEKSFPGVTHAGFNSLEYTNLGDFKDASDSNVKALHLSTAYTENQTKWTENYRALVWLCDNMYLKDQSTATQRHDYIAKAFATYKNQDVETVEAMLTDDDIDVVQQYAIWYFTNNDVAKYNVDELPPVKLVKHNITTNTQTEGSYKDITGYAYRQDMADQLFKFLVEEAKKGTATETVTYPEIAATNPKLQTTDTHFVVGPFRVNAGTAAETESTIKLFDQNANEIPASEYLVAIEGATEFTNKKINEIFGQNYYIYLPKTNKTITKVTLQLEYSKYQTEATLWENKTTDENGVEVYQPLVLLTRDQIPYKNDISVNIERKSPDLALRKYIVKVNDKSFTDRAPVVDVTPLKDGSGTTALYKHAKAPIEVQAGDTVVYEIAVYNEGDERATGTVVVDALPKGLTLAENSTINNTYGWTLVKEGNNTVVYKSEYLANTAIEGFNKDTDNALHSAKVQIECKIAKDATASSVLTNVAEIYADNIDDRDSTPDNNDYAKNDISTEQYTGNNDNKKDLTDKNYYYEGREDDDDFEKVVVKGKAFDLAIQKFITQLNGKDVTPSRVPQVDVKPLKDGAKDAKYTTVKTPLTVKKGDIVTYTIRVYNEGEMSGYAEEIADYIPTGLGFLVNHNNNYNNGWAIPTGSQTVKLNTIDNAINNVKLTDFKDTKKLEDVDVVVGEAKIVTTKLKSSTANTNNLIKAFDPEKDTTLAYKDVTITCVVLADKVEGTNLRNITEITDDSDENRQPVKDRDSNPNSVDPKDYTTSNNEDDDDYENVKVEEQPTETPKVFDLSLLKFITKVDDKQITDRTPKVTVTNDGKIGYSTNSDPLQVANNQLITYTIRVYNEGEIDGYAKEVADDIPEGLVFVADNAVNKKYEWKMYDKNGNVTTDVKSAVSVKTDYLSKEKSDARSTDKALIKAFDGKTVDFKDVQIVFKIAESNVKNGNRQVINTAEITNDSDKDGNDVDDKDSTPGNNKEGEDDIDKEVVYVKYFDLSLTKDLVKIIITEDGKTREIALNSTDGLQKVEIHRKKLNTTTVKFVYNITVKNEGEIEGYATEITDYIPEGLEFIAAENSQWQQASKNIIKTNALANKLLKPGETASVQVVLKWINGENNMGLKTNTAEISADKNPYDSPDRDSTPNNLISTEDDQDDAEVFLSISTGSTPTYFILTITVCTIMATGIALIKKYVLD